VKARPLNEDEVEQAIRKIRSLYDDYIITFTKPFRLKNEFEDRYFEARKSRIDLTRFVLAELEVIRQLKKQEEDKVIVAEEKRFKKRSRPKPTVSIADRVLEQHRKQIEKYPDLSMDDRASFEIKKLFGALNIFEKEYWPPLETVLRHLYPSYYANPRIDLEPRIYALCPGAGNAPPILSRYEALLLRIPRSIHDVEWEEKRLVLESAFLLHALIGVMDQLPLNDCTDEQRATVEKTREYVHILITDFRLKDLKPTNLGG
jgi:hypothetical protein